MRATAIFLLVIGLGLQGCGVLSKTQVRQSKNYFETITNYASLVRRTTESLALVELESKTLKSALESSNQERITVVVKALTDYETGIIPPDSVERSLVYFEHYIQGYFLLVTNGYNKYSQFKSASSAIGPFSGVAVAIETLLKRKEPGVRARKRDDLKKHLLQSHDSIRQHIEQIQFYLNDGLIPMIQRIESDTKQEFEELLQSINRNNEPIDFFQNYNRELSRFFQRLYLIQKMVNHLETSLNLVLQAEDDLLTKIQTRQKIEPESVAISSLLREIEKAKALSSRLTP